MKRDPRFEPEPTITINGHLLTDAQAMTMRVALASFDTDLQNKKYAKELGDIAALYKRNVRAIYHLMFFKEPKL